MDELACRGISSMVGVPLAGTLRWRRLLLLLLQDKLTFLVRSPGGMFIGYIFQRALVGLRKGEDGKQQSDDRDNGRSRHCPL